MEFVFFGLAPLVLAFVAWWRILPRIGWSRWLSVPLALPFVQLVPLFMLAWVRWPIDGYVPGAASGYSQARGSGMGEQERETTNYCTNCGKPNPVADRICGSCGKEL